MEILLFIVCVVLFLVSWLVWAIIAIAVSVFLSGFLYFLFEVFMALTFNNLINAAAKLPGCLGRFVGFILALPFGAAALVLSIWSMIQGEIMAFRIFRPVQLPAAEFLKLYVRPWEGSWPGCMFLARFFVNHCQWLWGGADFMHAYFPVENGVWFPLGKSLPVEIMIVKVFLLALPYTSLFVVPLLFIVRSLVWPFIGALGRLPAISGNGTGQD